MEVLDLEEKKKSSPIGIFAIISFCLPVLIGCVMVYAVVSTPVIEVSDPSPASFTSRPSMLSSIIMWGMVLVGPVFTVISYATHEKRSFFKIAGLILNGLVLLLVALAITLAFAVDGGFY